MRNVGKKRDIKHVTTNEAGRDYLILKPNHHTAKSFSKDLLAIEIKRTQILMNKPVYLGQSLLEMRKIVICEFWYDYVNPKYVEKA